MKTKKNVKKTEPLAIFLVMYAQATGKDKEKAKFAKQFMRQMYGCNWRKKIYEL